MRSCVPKRSGMSGCECKPERAKPSIKMSGCECKPERAKPSIKRWARHRIKPYELAYIAPAFPSRAENARSSPPNRRHGDSTARRDHAFDALRAEIFV